MNAREMISLQLEKIDPLVGDAACHTRAPYVVMLSRKAQSEELTASEKKYLQDCELLTKATCRIKDEFGLIIKESIDITKDLPELKALDSKGKKNRMIAESRASIARRTIDFLQDSCKKMTIVDKCLDVERGISSEGYYIPVMPLYLSAKMMLYCAASNNIPLIINLFRLKYENANYLVDGASLLVYELTKDKARFVPVERLENSFGIVIDMISCYVIGTEAEVDSILCASLYAEFVEQFYQQDFATLFMMLAVGHEQYPKLAKDKESVVKSDLDSSCVEECSAAIARDFKVDLDKASVDEYKKLRVLASRYGMFRADSRYMAIDQKEKTIKRTDKTLPIFIDHVYPGDLSDARERNRELAGSAGSLRVNRESSFRGASS